ncbi:zinc-ribbon domain-containing protein [Rhodopila sp.]|uniref:zinc-ribbon domain-containing protein n=1 Tax=Rhodopila sp. TaxID=2480087 RepID=UPI003D0CDCA1
MRIVCPSCAAEYEVASTNLPPRRKVRCTRCGGQWTPVREAQIAAPEEPHPEGPAAMPIPGLPGAVNMTAMDRLAAARPAPASVALRAAWAATLVILIGSAAATVIWRGKVVQAWPPSAWILGAGHPGQSVKQPDGRRTPYASGKP